MPLRIFPLGILPGQSAPIALPSITVPALSVLSQSANVVTLLATGGGTASGVSAYIFQTATSIGGPYTQIINGGSNTATTASPTAAQSFYYRLACTVSDGRQSDWSPILTVTGTSSTARRYFGSYYVALSAGDIRSVNGIPHAGNVAQNANGTWTAVANSGTRSNTGPVANNVTALVVRYNWNELNPTGTTYDWSRPDKEIAQCSTFASGGVGLFMMIITRTFGTASGPAPNPMPADLAGFAEQYTDSKGHVGYQGWRWSPTVLTRFNTLCQKIGQRYNANVYFAGIATQETSTGNAVGGAGNDAYNVPRFKSALVAESNSITSNCPNARHMFYFNFINNGGKADLKDVCAQIKPNGVIVGGPNLSLGGGVANNCFPISYDYHNGTNTSGGSVTMPAGIGATFCACQGAEWQNIPPSNNPTATIRQRFNYGRGITNGAGLDAMPTGTSLPSLLNIDVWVPDWNNGNATPAALTNFNNGATDLMTAFPTIGNFTP